MRTEFSVPTLQCDRGSPSEDSNKPAARRERVRIWLADDKSMSSDDECETPLMLAIFGHRSGMASLLDTAWLDPNRIEVPLRHADRETAGSKEYGQIVTLGWVVDFGSDPVEIRVGVFRNRLKEGGFQALHVKFQQVNTPLVF